MEFFTPNELARILKLHPFTVARLAREKKIPGFKVGGVWRFPKEEFAAWIASRIEAIPSLQAVASQFSKKPLKRARVGMNT